MQNYRVRLESPVSETFRCQKAANSLDIDAKKKAVHDLNISCDLETPYNLGVIVGSSGSGKTTLAREIYGPNCFDFSVDDTRAVIDQFPDEMSYDECAEMLSGIGLTSVPCWIRPVYTLSNGQRARAIAALQMARSDTFVIDEWTSVVDRTVAKAMSNCLQKFVRKQNKRVTVLTCHYDVLEWLNADWIIDCNQQAFTDRRSLWRNYKRSETLSFDIRPVSRKTWRYFSKYHYLSDNLPGGHIETFGVFHGPEQIGFQCFANYTPDRKGHPRMMFSNRTVIHPDYVGLGLGMRVINITSAEMAKRGFDVRAKFSSVPVKKGFDRFPELWRLDSVKRDASGGTATLKRGDRGIRHHVKTYSYRWTGAPQ